MEEMSEGRMGDEIGESVRCTVSPDDSFPKLGAGGV